MKTIGIIGTRRRDSEEDFKKVEKEFFKIYEKGDIICSDLCPLGGDWFAVLLSLGKGYIFNKKERIRILNKIKNNDIEYKIKPLWFPADWEKYGKAAGFIRNSDIAKSDSIIACVADDRTGGTEDTIKKYLKLGKDKLILV